MKVNQYKCDPGEEAGLCVYKACDNKPQGSPMQMGDSVEFNHVPLGGGQRGHFVKHC